MMVALINFMLPYLLLWPRITLSLASTNPYCDLPCIFDGKEYQNSACDCNPVHSWCRDPDSNPKALRIFRLAMLRTHNDLRNKLALGEEERAGMQVGVADMRALDYDNELEKTARCWMNKCKFEHDKCRITPKFGTAGQNLFASVRLFKAEEDFKKAIFFWYDHIDNFNEKNMKQTAEHFGSATDLNTTDIEAFTQIAWAKSYRLGCARYYNKKADLHMVIACNYGPSGNVLNRRMYKLGPACSQCGKHSCNKKYKGLCGEIKFDGASRLTGMSTKLYVIIAGCLLYFL